MKSEVNTMAQMTAICGIDCGPCPARTAHLTNDDALRQKTATEWSKAFKADLKPADINCTGCTVTDGPHIGHCESMCEIRKCGQARKVTTCAACPDYACDKLTAFFKMAPEAKSTLDSLRR
jgi:hypothetical protein